MQVTAVCVAAGWWPLVDERSSTARLFSMRFSALDQSLTLTARLSIATKMLKHIDPSWKLSYPDHSFDAGDGLYGVFKTRFTGFTLFRLIAFPAVGLLQQLCYTRRYSLPRRRRKRRVGHRCIASTQWLCLPDQR